MEDEQNKSDKYGYTQDGGLTYIKIRFDEMRKIFEEKTDTQELGKLFLDLESLAGQYLENYKPTSGDTLLLELDNLRQDISGYLIGDNYFQDLINNYEQKFRNKNSVAYDQEIYKDLLDLAKRYSELRGDNVDKDFINQLTELINNIKTSTTGENYYSRRLSELQEIYSNCVDIDSFAELQSEVASFDKILNDIKLKNKNKLEELKQQVDQQVIHFIDKKREEEIGYIPDMIKKNPSLKTLDRFSREINRVLTYCKKYKFDKNCNEVQNLESLRVEVLKKRKERIFLDFEEALAVILQDKEYASKEEDLLRIRDRVVDLENLFQDVLVTEEVHNSKLQDLKNRLDNDINLIKVKYYQDALDQFKTEKNRTSLDQLKNRVKILANEYLIETFADRESQFYQELTSFQKEITESS